MVVQQSAVEDTAAIRTQFGMCRGRTGAGGKPTSRAGPGELGQHLYPDLL